MAEHLQVDLVEASSLHHAFQLIYCPSCLDEILHRDRHGLVASSLHRDPPEDPILASVERSGMTQILRRSSGARGRRCLGRGPHRSGLVQLRAGAFEGSGAEFSKTPPPALRPPPQPWRRPTTQPGAQHHGADRHANRLRHPSLSPTAPGRGRDQQGKPTLPQALRRTADLPHPRRDPPSTRSARVNCLTRYGSIPAAPETLAGPRWFIRNRRSSRAAPAMKEQCVLGCDGMKRLREKGGPGGQSG